MLSYFPLYFALFFYYDISIKLIYEYNLLINLAYLLHDSSTSWVWIWKVLHELHLKTLSSLNLKWHVCWLNGLRTPNTEKGVFFSNPPPLSICLIKVTDGVYRSINYFLFFLLGILTLFTTSFICTRRMWRYIEI